MQQEERDRTLLAILEPEDRHKIEEVVDEIIADDLPRADAPCLEAAANAFDQRAGALADPEKIVAWQIAAALRLRATEGPRLH